MLQQAKTGAAAQIEHAQASAAGQVTAARAETERAIGERGDAAEAARRADAEATRARQAETDARAETERARADAGRERDTLLQQHHAQLEAVAALTAAERTRAERAEQLLEAERADRRHLTTTSQPTATASCRGPLPGRQASSDRDRAPTRSGVPVPPPLPDDLDAVLRRMRFPYLRKAAPDVLATARAQRWDPADVVRILLEEEIRGRDDSGRASRRKAAVAACA